MSQPPSLPLSSGSIAGVLKWLWWPLALFAVLWLWSRESVAAGQLILDVPTIGRLGWLESQWTYLYLHLITILPVLALSFDRKVAYYRQWKYLFPAIFVIGGAFIAWDVVFTRMGVWGFNEPYLSGLYLLGLPLEEWLFFISVPFACVFIYECLGAYLGPNLLTGAARTVSWIMLVSCLLVGLTHLHHIYTSTTFLLCAAALGFERIFLRSVWLGRFWLAFLISVVPFFLVNGVLTGGFTMQPVVMYNPEEYFGLRLGSVPVDDLAYSFLLLFSVTMVLESLRKRSYI